MARSKKSKSAHAAEQPRGPVELVKWKRRPDEHDYPAAANYLSLLVADPELRAALVAELQGAPLVSYEAKDLLRASQLPQLTKANGHVALDLKKIRKRIPLSPVLLVRGDLVGGFPLQIADGYHRVCASHIVDENTAIPCRLIDLPVAAPAGRTPVRPVVRVPGRKVAPVAVASDAALVDAALVDAALVDGALVDVALVDAAPIDVAATAAAPAAGAAPVKKSPGRKATAAAGANRPAGAATSRKTAAGTTAARKTAARKTAARKAAGGNAAAAKAAGAEAPAAKAVAAKAAASTAAALPPADVAPASSSRDTDAPTA